MKSAAAIAVIVVALVAAYWFATGGAPDRTAPTWMTARPIAHRGLWTDGPASPENSLAAIDDAADSDVAIELDVQLTSDGRVVVFHDDDLERMTGTAGLVKDTPYSTVHSLTLLGGTEGIPTLYKALRRVGGRTPVFIEIKNRGEVGRLEDLVAHELREYDGQVAVMSFNPYSLARIAEKSPDVPRVQLSSALEGEDLKFYEKFLLSHLLMNWASKPDAIAYDLKELPSAETKLMRRRGWPLIGWTAETEAERDAAREYCDAVICNPDALPK